MFMWTERGNFMPVFSRQKATLQEVLDAATVEGELYEKLEQDKIRCFCLRASLRNFSGQARHLPGALQRRGKRCEFPTATRAGVQSDPVEKKTVFSTRCPAAMPSLLACLAATFHCSYCQNWVTSQALRDEAAGVAPGHFSPESLVQAARRTGARLVVSSYNEAAHHLRMVDGNFQAGQSRRPDHRVCLQRQTPRRRRWITSNLTPTPIKLT